MRTNNFAIEVKYNSWLKDMADYLDLEIAENTLALPESFGRGKFHEFAIEDGFKVLFGEMELENQVEIKSAASTEKEGFTIIFKYIEKGSSYFRPILGNYKEVKSGGVQFFSSEVNNHLIFPAESHSFIFMVFISMDWINANLSEFINQSRPFKNMVYGKRRIMHFEPLTNRFVRLFKDVFNSEFDKKLVNLIVKDKGFEAVVLFFDHYYKQFFSKDIQLSKYSIVDQKRLYGLVDFIKLNLDKELSLELLSKEAGFSKSKLQSMFHYFLHKSIYSFIKNLRLERSVELLLSTEEDIRFVANRLGYNSGTHFINIFKKHFGISPNRYRLNYRKQNTKTQQNDNSWEKHALETLQLSGPN